ncbi:MAG: hypothetical protein ACRDD1_16620, partial [Planctomycetia bacterium]
TTAATPLAVLTTGSLWVLNQVAAKSPLVLFELGDKTAYAGGTTWRAVRTAYAGWPALVAQQTSGKTTEPLVADFEAWTRFWRGDGESEPNRDLVVGDYEVEPFNESFLFGPYPDLSAGPYRFGPDETTYVGFDPARCLAIDPVWFEFTYGQFAPTPIDTRGPPPGVGLTAKPVSLTVAVDRQQLADELEKHRQATQITVELQGSGRTPMKPVALRNKSLTVRCQPGLELVGSEPGEALFDLTGGGSLRIEGGSFILPAGGVKRFARVAAGDLHLVGCRVTTDLRTPNAKSLPELVVVEGPGSPIGKPPRRVLLSNVLLAASAPLLSVAIPQTDFWADNCVLVGGDDGVRLRFQNPPEGDWTGSVQWSKCTVSTAGSAVVFDGYPAGRAPPPNPVVVAMRDCLFTDVVDAVKNPRLARIRTGSVASYSGDALVQAATTWQGDHNAFDRRLARFFFAQGDVLGRMPIENSWRDWQR